MERAKRRTANSVAWRLPTASRKMARPSVSYFARNFRETPTAETYIGDFSSRPRFHSKLARSKRYANSRLKENTKRNEYDGRLVEKDLQQKEIKSYKINLEFLIYNNFELKISRGGAQVERNGGVTTLLKTNSEMQKGNWDTVLYIHIRILPSCRENKDSCAYRGSNSRTKFQVNVACKTDAEHKRLRDKGSRKPS